MTALEIQTLQDKIESVLSESVDVSDGHAVKGKLGKLSEYLVHASNCVIYAKNIYLNTHRKWLRQHQEEINLMKPSVAKNFVDTSCVDEQILLVRCELNYKNLGKCSDDLITILSFIKAEMSL